jgi:DNA-binding MarR family transcriptional regulator
MLDLAGRLGVTRGGLTRIIDRLVERGWIERDRPGNNRREVYAVLTDQGRQVMADARAVYVRVLGDTLGACLDADDLRELGRISGKLLTALHEGVSCPTGAP